MPGGRGNTDRLFDASLELSKQARSARQWFKEHDPSEQDILSTCPKPEVNSTLFLYEFI